MHNIQVAEINQCTKAGQLHKSLSGPHEESTGLKQPTATEFVKASQLLGVKTSVDDGGRNSSLHSSVPASSLLTDPPAVKCLCTSTVSSSANETSVSSSSNTFSCEKPSTNTTTQRWADRQVGFCKASELIPNHASKRGMDSVSPVNTITPILPLQKSQAPVSKLNSVSVNHLPSTSEGGTVKNKEASKPKGSGRKAKINPTVAKSKKITSFFEK